MTDSLQPLRSAQPPSLGGLSPLVPAHKHDTRHRRHLADLAAVLTVGSAVSRFKQGLTRARERSHDAAAEAAEFRSTYAAIMGEGDASGDVGDGEAGGGLLLGHQGHEEEEEEEELPSSGTADAVRWLCAWCHLAVMASVVWASLWALAQDGLPGFFGHGGRTTVACSGEASWVPAVVTESLAYTALMLAGLWLVIPGITGFLRLGQATVTALHTMLLVAMGHIFQSPWFTVMGRGESCVVHAAAPDSTCALLAPWLFMGGCAWTAMVMAGSDPLRRLGLSYAWHMAFDERPVARKVWNTLAVLGPVCVSYYEITGPASWLVVAAFLIWIATLAHVEGSLTYAERRAQVVRDARPIHGVLFPLFLGVVAIVWGVSVLRTERLALAIAVTAVLIIAQPFNHHGQQGVWTYLAHEWQLLAHRGRI